MNIFLETKDLFLKKPTKQDLPHILSLQSDMEVMKYIGGSRTPEIINTWHEKAIQHYQKHGFSFCCVFEKTTGNFVGQAGLFYLAYDDSQPDIEVGYRLHQNAWGKGYATRLTKALIQWGFQHLNIDRLVAVVNLANEKSLKVLEKSGMAHAGKIKYYDADADIYEIYRMISD